MLTLLKQLSCFWLMLSVLAPAFAVEVTDDLGHAVVLERSAQRIVSLAPHLTELLYAAGAGARVVGAVDYSDYPAAAKKITRIGAYSNIDLETVVALQPDLIVAWHTGNSTWQIDHLRRLGFALYLSEPKRLGEIPDTLERLGRLVGTVAAAGRAAEMFRAKHRALKQRGAGREVISVFYEIWNRPLMTVNGDHLINDVIELCGGRNVFYDLSSLAPTISIEAVLRVDPEVIVASGMGVQRPEWLDEWRRWRDLSAVKYGNLFFIPPDILQRHSPRILDGAEQMCRVLAQARLKRQR